MSALPIGQMPAHEHAPIVALLFTEARLLDERQFEAWCDLYTDDAVYWAPTDPDQVSPETAVSLFLDDKKTMLARIRRLRHPEAHLQTPHSHTVHAVTNIEIEPKPATDGSTVVHAVFHLAEWRRGEPRWYAGRYRYTLRATSDGWRIAGKKVTLVDAGAAHTAMAIYL